MKIKFFMQKELKIKANDGKLIYGTLAVAKKKSDKLIIFVHGFTGHRNYHMLFNGARFFSEKGFDTFRFDLYSTQKKARNFSDTKISQHGRDITDVLKFFRDKYKKIYVVGHSYGGTSLLFVDQYLADGFIFWDASYVEPDKDSKGNIKYNKALDAYILDWRIETIIGKNYIQELKHFLDCGSLINKINIPVLFITAGKGAVKHGIKYFKAANEPKKLVNIKTANHNFDDWKDEDFLFKKTFDWLI